MEPILRDTKGLHLFPGGVDMPRWISVFAVSVVLFGCVALGAQEPPQVSRVDPATGERHLLAEIPTAEQGESGLLGMELHPDFPGTPYVYFMQSYSEGGEITNRLLRYSFEAGALRNRELLIDGIVGNTYHDGARLAFGPSGYLYVTTGDAGRPRIARTSKRPGPRLPPRKR
jgi:aldose sugar dehydrogenase